MEAGCVMREILLGITGFNQALTSGIGMSILPGSRWRS